MVERGHLGGHQNLHSFRSPHRWEKLGHPWRKAALGADHQRSFPKFSAESFLRLRTRHCDSIHEVQEWGLGGGGSGSY